MLEVFFNHVLLLAMVVIEVGIALACLLELVSGGSLYTVGMNNSMSSECVTFVSVAMRLFGA